MRLSAETDTHMRARTHILAHTSKTQQDVNCTLGQDAMGMICNLQMRAGSRDKLHSVASFAFGKTHQVEEGKGAREIPYSAGTKGGVPEQPWNQGEVRNLLFSSLHT